MNRFAKPLLASVEAYRHHKAQSGPWHALLRKVARMRHMWWSMLTQSDIGLGARIGRDLCLPHPNGVVIHEDATIGDNCMIMQQVTIGMIREGEVPRIGNNVYIGAGAKIIGKLKVGDGARVGANAVVMTDVPSNCTAVGIPARIFAKSLTESSLRKTS